MDLTAASNLARSLMAEHLDKSWRFELDNARRRGGACHDHKRVISMSRYLVPMWDAEDVRETILHEIGHAIVGAHHGHDNVWAAAVRYVGGVPTRTHTLPTVPGRYLGTCPAGHTTHLYRWRNRRKSCLKCHPQGFSVTHMFSWVDTKTGVRVG